MKIVNDLLSALALATDVTDRDVFSHVELLQDALYPLPELPAPVALDNTSGLLHRTSWMVYTRLSRNNEAAESSISLGTFGRGLWRVNATVQMSNNFTSEAVESFRLLLERPLGGLSGALVYTSPFNGTNSFVVSRLFMFQTDTTVLVARLTGNGVGQISFVNVAVDCSKLL